MEFLVAEHRQVRGAEEVALLQLPDRSHMNYSSHLACGREMVHSPAAAASHYYIEENLRAGAPCDLAAVFALNDGDVRGNFGIRKELLIEQKLFERSQPALIIFVIGVASAVQRRRPAGRML